MGEPVTGSASGSTAAGVQPRPHERSFGASVFDLAGNALGEDMPRMSPQVQAHLTALIDSGLERAISAVRDTGENSANASRWVIRTLLTTVVVLSFAVVGVLIWSLDSRLDKYEDKHEVFATETQKQLDGLAAHRVQLDANVKMLAAHAVSLTENTNKTGVANYEMLGVLVDKLDARKDIPASHTPPVKIGIPVTLRVVAGEK